MPFRKLLRAVALFVLAGILMPAFASIPAHDIPGSHDSPLISRFPRSVIVGYQTIDFDQATFPLGKYDGSSAKFAKNETPSGKITRIAYVVPSGKSATEVFRNYQTALKQAGFTTQFQCERQGCGDDNSDFSQAIMTTSLMQAMAGHADSSYYNALPSSLWAIGNDLHYLTADLKRPQGNVTLSVMVVGNPGEPVGVLQQIVEAKPMKTGEVTVNAKVMSQGLAQNGHIALYGIHFATDSAALAPDSNATLAQMVALLKAQPKLKVFIVGHTDNTGTLQHNLVLSQLRAQSVVNVLEKSGISASRLAAKGLASYAPVASNATGAGRARNRRVELVEQ